MKQLFSFVIFEIICCTQFVGDLCYERWFRFSTYKLFPSFIYSTKSWSLLNSPIIKKIYYLKLLFSFLTFFRLSHMYILCWELISWKKVLLLFVCFTLQKKLDRSSYYVTMTHYVVILILFLFTFVVNVQDLEWDNFLVLTMNRKRVTRIYLPRA